MSSTVAIITMGCAKNEVDSTTMGESLMRAGYRLVEDPQTADCIIVNTCSFIQEATEESIEAVLEAASLGSKHLVLAGCMAARYGDELAEEFPEVSAFVPCKEEKAIASVLDELFGHGETSNHFEPSILGLSDTDEPFAYIKISEGCDRFCSYCTIPYIRGRYFSYSKEAILNACARAVDLRKRELVLIAQDTGRWGQDLEGDESLATLLDFLAEHFPSTWLRVMYIQPEGITDELLNTVAAHDNICSYFDIPFQHCNEDILQAMNRKGSAAQYLSLIQHIRDLVPNVTLRTTLMVGFPGESAEAFDELLEFVEEASLDYIGTFAYSQEEGAKAAQLSDQIDEETKLERLAQLRDLADTVSSAVIAQRQGSTCAVLSCGFEEDGQCFGRTQAQAPEVDGLTFINDLPVGAIATCTIEDTLGYEMEGTVSLAH